MINLIILMSVNTVRLSCTTLTGTCAFWGFQDSGPHYIHLKKNGGTQQGLTVKGMREWSENMSKLGAFHALQNELENQDSVIQNFFAYGQSLKARG